VELFLLLAFGINRVEIFKIAKKVVVPGKYEIKVQLTIIFPLYFFFASLNLRLKGFPFMKETPLDYSPSGECVCILMRINLLWQIPLMLLLL